MMKNSVTDTMQNGRFAFLAIDNLYSFWRRIWSSNRLSRTLHKCINRNLKCHK